MSFDELDDLAAEYDEQLRLLRDAECTIHKYLSTYGDIEICFDEGCQDIRNFQGFEINPLSL